MPKNNNPSIDLLPAPSSSQQQNPASPGECEPIRDRLVELMEILLESMAADPEAGAITAMGPVVVLMLKNYESTKLVLLIRCLSEIGRAVLDLDSSQETYNDRMEPLIRGLAAALS